MGVITLLQDFAFVGALGQSFSTPWVSFPAEHQNGQIVAICKSIVSGTIVAQVQTTWDTDSEANVGTALTTGVQVTTEQTATGWGPLIRVKLSATVANTICVISIYVTPKSA